MGTVETNDLGDVWSVYYYMGLLLLWGTFISVCFAWNRMVEVVLERVWMQCIQCHGWSHYECTRQEELYICHNCESEWIFFQYFYVTVNSVHLYSLKYQNKTVINIKSLLFKLSPVYVSIVPGTGTIETLRRGQYFFK